MTRDTFQGSRVLVTGGAGFIGSHLVDELLAVGAQVRVLDNLTTGSEENLTHCLDQIDFSRGDIRDAKTCSEACSGVRFVFHQAALGSVPRSMQDPATTIAVNASGTANVFSAARDQSVERVVYASSSSVYGDSPVLPKREGEEGRPLSPYALSKQMCELLADQFGRSFGTELVGLRYFNVFGSRQSPDGPYAAVIPRFFKAFLSGDRPVVFGDGTQSRDFTPVGEAVRANLLAATAAKPGVNTAINVATGTRTTVNGLATAIGRLVGSDLAAEHRDPRLGDVPHSHADLSRAHELLGYRPQASLADGLRGCLTYYRELFAGAAPSSQSSSEESP